MHTTVLGGIRISFTPEGYAEIAMENGNKIAGTFAVSLDADDVRTFVVTPLRTLDEIKTVHDKIRDATEGAERVAALREGFAAGAPAANDAAKSVTAICDALGKIDLDAFNDPNRDAKPN